MKPKIFIGSSSEGLEVAYAVQRELEGKAFVTIWNQDIFLLSSYTLEELLRIVSDFSHAVFILKADDRVISRGEELSAVRDNVLLEMGLFLGHFKDRRRVFLLKPASEKNMHMPSDLTGINVSNYDDSHDDNLRAAVGSFCSKLIEGIKKTSNSSLLSIGGSWTERWNIEEQVGTISEYFEDKMAFVEHEENQFRARLRYKDRTYVMTGVVENFYVTGTWKDAEVGPTYTGAFQLIIGINGKTMNGKWVGFSSREFIVKSGFWEWVKNDN